MKIDGVWLVVWWFWYSVLNDMDRLCVRFVCSVSDMLLWWMLLLLYVLFFLCVVFSCVLNMWLGLKCWLRLICLVYMLVFW